MDVVDLLLQYRKTYDINLLITSDLKIDKVNLNVIVIEILSWLKLEHKRSMWIAEGRKNCLKPLKINMQYPWCVDLNSLVEKEKLFHDSFIIKEGKLEFSDLVSEKDRVIAREKAYRNYNPQKNT